MSKSFAQIIQHPSLSKANANANALTKTIKPTSFQEDCLKYLFKNEKKFVTLIRDRPLCQIQKN
ncbi:MAG: hypothetical protein HON23_06025 [Rickettsiales bacterium]|nr:hypothetical protein [Rickettsiales bacterium]